MSGGTIGHLLVWEMHERDGSWQAWVSWVQETGGLHTHKVVDVCAGSLQQEAVWLSQASEEGAQNGANAAGRTGL